MDDADVPNVPTHGTSIERAWLLYHADRYEGAAKELRGYLATEPDDSEAHTLLSLCLSEIEDNKAIIAARGISEALREAVEGIRQGPDRSLAYFAHAVAFDKLDRFRRAEAGIREAIRLDPENSYYYGFLAYLHNRKSSWADALETAEIALSIDPNYTQCANIRALALYHLNRFDEARAAAHQTLETDPENATGHGLLGMLELRKGRARQAIAHFQTALRLDSTLEWAVEGNIEAQQKSTFFYRFIASKVFWVAELPRWAWIMVIVAGWIGAHLAPRLTKGHANRIVPVAVGLLIYFLLNALVRFGDPLLKRLVPISRISKRKVEVTHLNDWDAIEIAYLVSLAFMPVSVIWPHGLILSIFADVLLVLAIGADVDRINRGTILLFVMFVALDFWLRG